MLFCCCRRRLPFYLSLAALCSCSLLLSASLCIASSDGSQVVAKKLLARQTSGHEMSMASEFHVRVSLLCVVGAWFARVRALTAPWRLTARPVLARPAQLSCSFASLFPSCRASSLPKDSKRLQLRESPRLIHTRPHNDMRSRQSATASLDPRLHSARCCTPPVDAHSCFHRCMRFPPV
jgi:hypothetical protein